MGPRFRDCNGEQIFFVYKLDFQMSRLSLFCLLLFVRESRATNLTSVFSGGKFVPNAAELLGFPASCEFIISFQAVMLNL